MGYWEPEEDYFGVDENFDFNTGINKLLEEEIEKRLSIKVKGYEEAIERDTESRKVIAELKRDLRVAKHEFDEAKEMFFKEGADEKARELLGGFKLGDEVWFKKVNHSRSKCPTCLGDRKVLVEIKGEEVKVECPKCKGGGSLLDSTSTAEKGVVKEIKIHTWYHGKKLETEMWIEPTSYRSIDSISKRLGSFYKTKEECEAALKE